MVDGMFEPCPLINHRECGFCTHHKGHIYCGASRAGKTNKIQEDLLKCPVPRLRKKEEVITKRKQMNT
jgi:hypothetical protein